MYGRIISTYYSIRQPGCVTQAAFQSKAKVSAWSELASSVRDEDVVKQEILICSEAKRRPKLEQSRSGRGWSSLVLAIIKNSNLP